MKVHKVLVLAAAGIIVGKELENDHRKHDLYHVELHSFVEGPKTTRQIRVDSGSSSQQVIGLDRQY